MSSTAISQGVIGQALLTYAKGLASMAAAGFGVFASFCLYVSAQQGLLRGVDVSFLAGSIFLIFFIIWGSRNDKPGAPEHRYAIFSLWVFYVIACTEAVIPVLRTYANETFNYWSMPVVLLMVGLRAIWDYVNLRINRSADGRTSLHAQESNKLDS